MNKRKYTFTDDSWVDGYEDCPCCSGLTFECYNLESYPEYVESPINHSVSSEHELFGSVLLMECGVDYVEGGNPYDAFTLQELKDAVKRCNVGVEIL